MPLERGQLFAGDFRIERELSRGGMGQVYVATQLSTGRERALKVMRPELVEDPSLRKRFEQEAKVGANIKSDHIVEVIAAGIDEATRMPWLAMELLEGESLGALIERRGGLSPDEARDPLGQLAHALEAAHAAGVVHRDLKPENVFVSRTRRATEMQLVKVLDFGIAKVVAEVRATATAPIGTLFWMAPEQADTDGDIGPPTDVWAFGLIVFYVLTGRMFWDEKASVPTLLKKLTVDPLPRASERAQEIGRAARLPRGFDKWFANCAAREPADRYADIAEANGALEHLLTNAALSLAPTEPLVATPASRAAPQPTQEAKPSSSRAWPLAAMALAALAIAAFAIAKRDATSTDTVASASASTTSSSSATPIASASASAASPARFKLAPDDDEDHDTVFRVPLGDSPRRGAAEPLVVIVEFAEFQCPYARGFEDNAKAILDAYPDDVAIVWKDLPLGFHPVAEPAARVARLARALLGDAGFWKAHDLLFAACTNNEREALERVGHELGLPAAKVRAAIDGVTPDAVERDVALALELGDLGTPTHYINGRQVAGNQSFERMRPLIDEEIAKAKKLIASGVPRTQIYDAMQKAAVPGVPFERVRRNVPIGGPVLAGAHAVVDVHQFADETNVFSGLSQPVVDYVLREYGDRIRFYWHSIPDIANTTSTRVAQASEAAYSQNGNAVFWKFHRLLVDNQPWPFKDPSHKDPRGFGDDALLDYARTAGVSVLYLRDALMQPPKLERWQASRQLVMDVRDVRLMTGMLYADGYVFGWDRRRAKWVLDRLIAEKQPAK